MSEEERGELEGASSGEWLTALSKILQIHENSAKTCPGGYRFDPFDVDVGYFMPHEQVHRCCPKAALYGRPQELQCSVHMWRNMDPLGITRVW